MLIDLKSIQNNGKDSIFLSLSDSSLLEMNFIDESITLDGKSFSAHEINLERLDYEGNFIGKVSNVIGLETGTIQLITENPELIGKKLTAENKDECYLLTLF